jgi:glucuronate isomerase
LKIGKMEDTGFFKVIKQLCHSVERTNGRWQYLKTEHRNRWSYFLSRECSQ